MSVWLGPLMLAVALATCVWAIDDLVRTVQRPSVEDSPHEHARQEHAWILEEDLFDWMLLELAGADLDDTVRPAIVLDEFMRWAEVDRGSALQDPLLEQVRALRDDEPTVADLRRLVRRARGALALQASEVAS